MLALLGGYLWVFVHRPFEVWTVLGDYHFERLYMLATMAFWGLFAQKGWVSNRLNLAFFAFTAVLIFDWLASPYRDLGQEVIENHIKTAIFYVLVLSTVRDERSLRLMVMMFLAAMGLYMTHSLKEFFNGRHEFRMGIIRMIGVDQTFNNPNSFAATIVVALPLSFPFWGEPMRPRYRLLLLYYTLLSVVCILLTGSRGNLVTLLCLGMLKLVTSKHRVRTLLLLALALPVGWTMLTPRLQNRFLTLVDPSYGPKNAQESAEFRSHALVDGARLWEQSPLTGHGPGSFGKAAGHGWQAHNLYAQVIGEMGTLGALALAAILGGFLLNALEIRRLTRGDPELEEGFLAGLSGSIAASIILLLILGMSGHNLYRYNWMWFGAFQAITLHCVKARAQEID